MLEPTKWHLSSRTQFDLPTIFESEIFVLHVSKLTLHLAALTTQHQPGRTEETQHLHSQPVARTRLELWQYTLPKGSVNVVSVHPEVQESATLSRQDFGPVGITVWKLVPNASGVHIKVGYAMPWI